MPCPNYRRKRTISKAFRVSREESERIELLAKAAGVTQQEYIIAKIEDKEFTVVPASAPTRCSATRCARSTRNSVVCAIARPWTSALSRRSSC